MALVPAMVCLVLVGLLCAAVLRLAHAQRGAVAREGHRMQAEWLAESGLARAAARLAADDGYKGETWDVPASALGGGDAGRVTITVTPADGRRGRREVRAEADFPRDEARRARLTRTRTLDSANDRSND